MNIRFMETVIWLARLRSIRAVADKLHISQTGIASRIGAIEEELGIRLFARDDQGFVPTVDGQYFIDSASQIVEAYRALETRLRDPDTLKGAVRLGAVPALAYTLLPRLIKKIRKDFQYLRVEFETDNHRKLLSDLESGGLDLAFVVDMGVTKKGVATVGLMSLAMSWVASPTLLTTPEEPMDTVDLARYPIIGYVAGTSGEDRLKRFLRGIDADQLTIFKSNSLATTIHLAKSGLGVAAVPLIAIQDEIKEGLLNVIRTVDPLVHLDYLIAYSQDALSPLQAAVVALSREAARELCDDAGSNVAWQKPSL